MRNLSIPFRIPETCSCPQVRIPPDSFQFLSGFQIKRILVVKLLVWSPFNSFPDSSEIERRLSVVEKQVFQFLSGFQLKFLATPRSLVMLFQFLSGFQSIVLSPILIFSLPRFTLSIPFRIPAL